MSKINIIKHGRLYFKKIRFDCSCGCCYEVVIDDTVNTNLLFEINEMFDFYNIHCECPECGKINSTQHYL